MHGREGLQRQVTCIAIVDDEEPVREALERLLGALGLETESYASGRDFLAARREPDCLLLDLYMPGMSGLEVLRELRAARRRLPALVITARDEPEACQQCLAAGAAACLRKPLDGKVLINAISEALS